MSSQPKVVRYCLELIRTPSLSGSERDVAYLIKDFMSSEGIDKVFIDGVGNVIGVLKGSQNYSIIFEGHMDHVPPGDESLWQYPPYKGVVVNDKIIGRGAADMKGAIAAMISTIEVLGKQKNLPTIYYIFVPHEEIAEGVAFKYAVENSVKVKPKLVILGEATSLNIHVGQRGRAVFKIIIKGKTAHASMPSEGVNPLIAASHIISKLQELNLLLKSHELLGKGTITPTIIECLPKSPPMIPDYCEIIVDRRFVINESETSLINELKNIVNYVVKEGLCRDSYVELIEGHIETWKGVKLKVKQFFPAWITPTNDLTNKILQAVKKEVPYSKIGIWRFSTDGVYSAGTAKIHTLGLGPGNESLAHKPNEYVTISELKKAWRSYIRILNKFILNN